MVPVTDAAGRAGRAGAGLPGTWRRAAVWVMLAVAAGAGCGRPEARRIHRSDIPVKVTLTREFIRSRSDYSPEPLQPPIRGAVGKELARHRDGAAFLFVLTLLSLASNQGTRVTIEPKDLPKYRQDLYWGKNKVYLPAACRGRHCIVILDWGGAWGGDFRFRADLTRAKPRLRF